MSWEAELVVPEARGAAALGATERAVSPPLVKVTTVVKAQPPASMLRAVAVAHRRQEAAATVT